jgi:hypothetical protein
MSAQDSGAPLAQGAQRFGFDVALQLMRQGKSVRRASWQRADMRISLPGDRAIMQSAPSCAHVPWRWTIDHASLLATDWELAAHD